MGLLFDIYALKGMTHVSTIVDALTRNLVGVFGKAYWIMVGLSGQGRWVRLLGHPLLNKLSLNN
jgi:hypothetical protein